MALDLMDMNQFNRMTSLHTLGHFEIFIEIHFTIK